MYGRYIYLLKLQTIKIKQMWVNIPSMENLGGNVWDEVTKSPLTFLAYFAKLQTPGILVHSQTIPVPKKKHPEKGKWNSETFCLFKDQQIASQFSSLPKNWARLESVSFQISHAATPPPPGGVPGGWWRHAAWPGNGLEDPGA